MWNEEKVRIPVTLVNEYNSSMEAKAQIAQIVSNSIGLSSEQKAMKQLNETMNKNQIQDDSLSKLARTTEG